MRDVGEQVNINCYLVKKEYDEDNGRMTSSFCRTDGPIRVNKFGVASLNVPFRQRQIRRDYYLVYMREGSLDVCLSGQNYTLCPGDTLIYPPNCRFDYGNSESVGFSYYYAHFSGTDAVRLLDALGFTSLPAVYSPGVMEAVAREFEDIFALHGARVRFLDEIASATLVRILTLIARKLSGTDEILPPWNAVNYINRNLDRPLRVGELARLEHMSESRFYTVFRREVGMSPVDYINAQRIDRATDILDRSNIGVAEVGRMVGFPDVCFFSKEFKKRVGMSPSEYKKRFSK